MSELPLLSIRGLSVDFATSRGRAHVLRGVDLDIARGRIVGLVGESGSGKSTLALAILGLLPPNAGSVQGAIRFDDVDLLNLSAESLRSLRGRRIAMIFQDPMTALNPVFTVGTHLRDVLDAKGSGEDASVFNKRAIEMLAKVGIPDPEQRLKAYPHELSGGMRQRVMIAMALLTTPDLLIADEPTTALDVTIEAQIVALIHEMRAHVRGSILFISHSLGLVSELCADVVVMYAGVVVEQAPSADLFANPRHPYTRALIDCEIGLDDDGGQKLRSIPGEVLDPVVVAPGCTFAARCSLAEPRCHEQAPQFRSVAPNHGVACFRA